MCIKIIYHITFTIAYIINNNNNNTILITINWIQTKFISYNQIKSVECIVKFKSRRYICILHFYGTFNSKILTFSHNVKTLVNCCIIFWTAPSKFSHMQTNFMFSVPSILVDHRQNYLCWYYILKTKTHNIFGLKH